MDTQIPTVMFHVGDLKWILAARRNSRSSSSIELRGYANALLNTHNN